MIRSSRHLLFSIARASISSPTIFALATAPSPSAVAVIRLSGPHAGPCLDSLTSRPRPPPRYCALRSLNDPHTGECIDRALVIWFPAPSSYTGEDMVELQLHGGVAVIAGVTHALRNMDGVREAGPGEFTRKAVMNDKMDLTQAEGVMDLVRAQSALQRRQALKLSGGEFKQQCDAWKEDISQSLALMEALIDFAEDEPIDETGTLWLLIRERIVRTQTAMERAIKGSTSFEMVSHGVRLSLVGPPNAGKSSLFNCLLKRQAAIVSPEAGTTRDVVHSTLSINGNAVSIADTAGVRATENIIEKEGVRRALAYSRECDARIVVLDSTGIPQHTAILDSISDDIRSTIDKYTVLVLNKTDLTPSLEACGTLHITDTNKEELAVPYVAVSCVTGQGISELEHTLDQIITKRLLREGVDEGSIILHHRHTACLELCNSHLSRSLSYDAYPEIAAEELRGALRSLGDISGSVSTEQLLDRIFSDFCIGK